MEVKRSFKASSTYPGRIVCLFTDNVAETAKRLEPEETDQDTYEACCWFDEKPAKPGSPLIVLAFGASVGTIIHECDHVAFYMLKFWGVPVTYDDNEAHAYLLEAIVEKILKLQGKLNNVERV